LFCGGWTDARVKTGNIAGVRRVGPMTGTRSLAQLTGNHGALVLILSPDQLAQLNRIRAGAARPAPNRALMPSVILDGPHQASCAL